MIGRSRSVLLMLTACLVVCGALLAVGAIYAEDVPDELEKAAMLYRAGHYNDAIAEIDRVLMSGLSRSMHARVLSYRAAAYMKKGEIDTALQIWTQVTTDYPDIRNSAAGAQLRIGYLHLKRGDTAPAIAAFEKVASFEPADQSLVSDAKYRLAVLKQKRARNGEITFEEAKSAAEDLLASFGDDSRIQNVGNLILAEIAFAQGEYLESVDKARTAITKYPHSTYPGNFTPFDLTTSYASESSVDQAAYAKLFIGLAYAMREPYYLDSAIASYREVLSGYPSSKACAEAQFRIGEALYKLAKYDEAIVELEKVLSNYPTDEAWRAWAVYRKGFCYVRKKLRYNSEQEWQKVIDHYLGQTMQMLRSKLAIIEYRTMTSRQWDKAAGELEAMIDRHPEMKQETAEARRLLISSYYKLRRHDDVIRVCKDTVALYPGSVLGWHALLAQYYMGLSYVDKGETDLAIAAYERALRHPMNVTVTPRVRVELAKAYAARGETARAIAQLDAVKADDRIGADKRAEALYKKGLYLSKSGDREGARSAFRELIDKFGDNYLSARAAERLARLK